MPTPAPFDRQLVDRFVAAIKDFSTYEAERITGVGNSTIHRFRRGDWSRLQASTREKIENFLRAAGGEDGLDGAGEDQPRPVTDRELVDVVLESLTGFTHRDAAAMLGVSEGSIRRWREGVVSPLRKGIRDALIDFFILQEDLPRSAEQVQKVLIEQSGLTAEDVLALREEAEDATRRFNEEYPSGETLITKFLSATEGIDVEDVARQSGVPTLTVTRLRRGERPQLKTRVEYRMVDYLKRAGVIPLSLTDRMEMLVDRSPEPTRMMRAAMRMGLERHVLEAAVDLVTTQEPAELGRLIAWSLAKRALNLRGELPDDEDAREFLSEAWRLYPISQTRDWDSIRQAGSELLGAARMSLRHFPELRRALDEQRASTRDDVRTTGETGEDLES